VTASRPHPSGLLQRSPSSKVQVLRGETPAPAQTLDEIAGLQFSYSFTAPALLREGRKAREADVRPGLLALEPNGRYEFGDLAQELITAVRP